MADVVQYRMERMTEELDDLERRGLFSRPEIQEIVRRRRDFEYRIKRPKPIKSDYLLYIDYETHLDALRNLRKRAIIGKLKREGDDDGAEKSKKKKKKGSGKWKKSISDVAGVMRILDVYRLAAARYKGDLELWFRYLEFCRERRHGRMKQVLAQAIRFHPKVPGLWIYAAAWEFDQNLNVAAARALMQSGLRNCPQSEDLWIEYLRMELTYLNKLKARKVALGEDVRTLPQDGGETKQWKEENKDLFVSLHDEKEETTVPDLQEGSLEKREDIFWQQGSKVLQTIYHGAIEAKPSSINLRKRFLEILDQVDLAHSDKLKEEVLDGLKKDFSHDEDYWDWMARLHISGSQKDINLAKEHALIKLNKAVEVYEEALSILPSVKMYSLYVKFWSDVISTAGEGSNPMLSNMAFNGAELSSNLLKVYERAELSGCLSEDLAHEYITYYLNIGRVDEARTLAEKLCTGKLSEAPKLWALRVTMEMKWLTNKSTPVSDDDMHSVLDLLGNVLGRLSIVEAEFLWLMAMKLFSNKKKHFEKLVNILMLALAKAGGSNSGNSIASAVVSWVLQRDGLKHARVMYKRFLSLPRPSLAFFMYCIELESNLAFAGDADGLGNARKLFESAIGVYSQVRELWKDYYALEMKVGTPETANAVYWRARKILKDTTGLATL